jgi:hypothetical protein
VQARREECLPSSWRAFNACSEGNRHQPAGLLACTLELGVILTARAPNRRRSSPAFGGRDDAGPRPPNTRERKWTRPHCSSSSSWYCCSAAVDSSTDAGLESEGRLARRLTAGAPRPWAVAGLGAIGDGTRREVYERHIVPTPFAAHTVSCQGKIATSRPRTPLAATQIDAGATCPSVLRHASPRTVGPYG